MGNSLSPSALIGRMGMIVRHCPRELLCMVLGVVSTQGGLVIVTAPWLRAPGTLGHPGDAAAPGFLLCPQVLVTSG